MTNREERDAVRMQVSMVLVVAAALVAGCTGGATNNDQPVPATLAGPFDQGTIDRFVGDLAAAGVGVYQLGSTTPVTPVANPSPMRLSDEQAANAALGAHHRSGPSGADLNTLVTPAALAPGAQPLPASLLIAAWAHNAESPAALLARRVLGDQDWARHEAAVFPTVVLTLFAADVAASAPPATPTPGPASFASRPGLSLAAPSVCEQFQGFVNSMIDAVFTAIGHLPHFDETTGNWWERALKWAGNHVANAANYAIDTVKFVVVNGQKVLLGPILSAIQSVASVVAVSSAILLALQPWTGEITPDPIVAHRGAAPQQGRFQLIVRTVGPSPQRWPPHVEGCATWAGVTLPSLTPRDAAVAWNLEYQHPEPMITKTGEDSRLTDTAQAAMQFETVVEPPDVAAGKEQVDGSVKVTAAIHRKDLDGVRDRLITAIWNNIPLPKILIDEIKTILKPHIDKALEPLTKLRDTQAYAILATTYHTKDDNSPTTTPTEPKNAVIAHLDTSYGGYIDVVSCDGPYGTWTGVVVPPRPPQLPLGLGDAPVRFTLTGPNKPTRLEFMQPGGEHLGTNVLDVSTDGTTMTWTGVTSPAERRGESFPPLRFPVTPAPAGRC